MQKATKKRIFKIAGVCVSIAITTMPRAFPNISNLVWQLLFWPSVLLGSICVGMLLYEYISKFDWAKPIVKKLEESPWLFIITLIIGLFIGSLGTYLFYKQKPNNQEVTDFKLLLRGGNTFMHKSRPGITGMALGVQIRNAGRTSSIATNWKLYIMESDKAPVLAQLINTPKELPPSVSGFDFSLREEAISKPIEYGDVLEGTLLFYIELPKDNVIKENTNIELKVDDIHGNTFSIVQNMGNWPIMKVD